jgi:hypothetical protein
MKSILIWLTSVMVFATLGWQVVDEPAAVKMNSQPDVVMGSSADQIAGTWHSFPNGLLIRFNRDGTADFGVDTDGKAIGYSANTWVKGDQLFITFSDYDGDNADCVGATGIYQTQQQRGGSLRFVLVEDACQFRATALSGRAELGSELLFHPVG